MWVVVVVIAYCLIGGLMAFLGVRSDLYSLKYYEHKYVWRAVLLWPVAIWFVLPASLDLLRAKRRQAEKK